MDKIIAELTRMLSKLTVKNVLLMGMLVLILAGGYFAYMNSAKLGELMTMKLEVTSKPFVTINSKSIELIDNLMLKYKDNAAYLTILRFDFQHNTRIPIYRSFNDDELRTIVFRRLNGGDGSLPILIKGDTTNNDQIVSLIKGESICDPFNAGGVARVWPDLANKFSVSCRAPIPPIYGSVVGYLVVHFKGPLRPYEIEAIKTDLMTLAVGIHNAQK